jgi:hypothetical protein
VEESATVTVPAIREEAVTLLMATLGAACPAGDVRLIGSLATSDRADVFSDIDVRWTVPQAYASGQLRSLRETLHDVGTVESLRVDPDERTNERLVFIRFEDWPLWWRVDLEIHSPGLEAAEVPDADPWCPLESACMGVVVTLKALTRGHPEAAEDLFASALDRADATDVIGSWPLRIRTLLDHIAARDRRTQDLVSRTRQLSQEVLVEERRAK